MFVIGSKCSFWNSDIISIAHYDCVILEGEILSPLCETVLKHIG